MLAWTKTEEEVLPHMKIFDPLPVEKRTKCRTCDFLRTQVNFLSHSASLSHLATFGSRSDTLSL